MKLSTLCTSVYSVYEAVYTVYESVCSVYESVLPTVYTHSVCTVRVCVRVRPAYRLHTQCVHCTSVSTSPSSLPFRPFKGIKHLVW